MKQAIGLMKIGLMITAGLILSAQNAESQVRLGAFAGASHFTVDQEDEIEGIDLDHRTGLVIGGVINLPLFNDFSLQVEPSFMHKGSKAEISGYGEVDIEGSYIELPILAKWECKQWEIRPYITGGLSFGYLLEAKQEASFIPYEAEDITDRTERFEAALTVGGGIEFPIAIAKSGFLQTRYYHGVTDSHKEEEHHESRGFLFMIGIMF